MEQQKRNYDAFISYRHLKADMAAAESLQKLLEKCKIRPEGGDGKKRTLCVFRDQSELPTSDDLGRDIRTALENSRYLIIICSPSYQDSRWCMEELQYFRSLHGGTNRNILPLLIEGEPEQSFPEEIFWEEIQVLAADGSIQIIKKESEPLAADIRSDSLKGMLKKLKSREYFRMAAPIMGVAFDDLYQRKKRAQRRTSAAAAAAFTVLSLAFGLYNWYMYGQIADRQSEILENESVRLADNSALQMSSRDYMLALLLAKEAYVLHEEADTGEPDSKAATALRSAVFAKGFETDVQPLERSAVISFNTEGWEIEDSLDGGGVLQITDGESTYLCSTATGEILYTFSGSDYVFSEDISRGVKINRVDTCQVLFQGIWTETGEVYFEYAAECRPASYIFAFYDDETYDCYLSVDGIIETYVSGEGEIFSCSMAIIDTDSLPKSVVKNIADGLRLRSYQENCDIVYDTGSSDDMEHYPAAGVLAMAAMSLQGYSEILLTNYNDDLILVSGKTEGLFGEYETQVYSSALKDCIYTLDGRYLLDRNNNFLYQRNRNQLIICQLDESKLKQNEFLSDTVFYWISDNGDRCCLMNNQLKDEAGENYDYAQVEIFDTNHMDRALICADVAMGDLSSVKYQLNSDLSKMIYENTARTVHVQEIGGESLLTVEFDEGEYINAVALDDSGTRAAVAYSGESAYISLYDIEQGTQITQIDLQEYRGGWGNITHMELLDDCLLVADYYNVYLFNLNQEEIPEPLCLEGSEQMSPVRRYLTEDGLLFCTECNSDVYGRQLYYLNKIYDTETGECILDAGYSAYDYDPSTGFLVYQPFSEYGTAPSITVMQRQQESGFRKVWSIKSDNVNMELLHNEMSLDGNFLLLSGRDTCEVYDLSTQYKVMETGFPGFSLKNKTLYYLMKNSDDALMSWSILKDPAALQNRADELLEGRVLSDEERSRYYILNDH